MQGRSQERSGEGGGGVGVATLLSPGYTTVKCNCLMRGCMSRISSGVARGSQGGAAHCPLLAMLLPIVSTCQVSTT